MTASQTSLVLGAISLALICGALGFQYIGGIAPCEVCHWQRWPHIAGAVVGLAGGALVVNGTLDERWGLTIACLTILLIALSGALGVYHAGVEWKLWGGPVACTGPPSVFNGLEGLNNESTVRCDQAAWRLLGLSLAGYNAIISFGSATLGALLVARRRS